MRALALAASLCACTLAFPMDEYDRGGGAPAGGGGAEAGGGEGGEPRCDGGPEPPLSSISSDFDAALGDELAFLNCPALVDGAVQIEPLGGDYCWLYTTGSHRLTCDAISFRVLDAGNQEVGVQRFIYLDEVPSGGRLNVLQEGGGFGGDLSYVDPTFSLAQDAWWRLRADQTTLFFETSPDGLEWNLKGSIAPSFSLEHVSVAIGAGNWNAVQDPGLMRFDCLNVPPPCGG